MNHFISLFIFGVLLLTAVPVFPNYTAELLEQNKALIAQKKYATAFRQLDSLDRHHQNVDMVLAKLDLALNFYATSIMHHFFGFEDLRPEQDITAVRGQPGKYNLHIFKVDEVIDSLILQHPDDYRLHKALGDYYYEVYLRYGDDWFMTTEEVLIKIDQHYLKAAQSNTADFETYFVLGFLRLGEQKWQDAAGYLDKSIAMNPYYPASYYNMAYALLQLNHIQDALEYSRVAWQLYEDDPMKADVARLMAVLMDEQLLVDSAVAYLMKGLAIAPGDYYLLKDYLDIAVREQLPERDAIRLEFFLLGPDNPTIYNILSEIYMAHEESFDPLIAFYNEVLPAFKGQDKVEANLYFFSGQLLFESNRQEAVRSFLKARSLFQGVFSAENPVFHIIEQYLNYQD
jgi:tetratricopeptide (TPR) repeat protein